MYTETDVLVIGSGPGGYVAAIRAAQLDLDVTLVEKNAPGGTCLNHGCIPSKALISATDIFHRAGNAETMGISGDLTVDLGSMIGWKDGVVTQLTGGVEKLCKANQVQFVDGTATFLDRNTARVARGDGDIQEITFGHTILATGSRPMAIPGFDFADEPILSSRDALGLTELPDSLLVVGAGYIGMELAGVFAKLGSSVTVVEMLDNVLPGYEESLSRPVERRARALGVEFAFGEAAETWHETGDGVEVVTLDEDGNRNTYAAERVLVAVGREPVTDTVDLDAIGLSPADDGFLATDEQGRTEVDTVFAIGDVAGEPMLAHKASMEGKVAAEAIAGQSSTVDERAIPAAVFTEPEVATVGLSPADAEAHGIDHVVGRFPFMASGRSLTLENTDGFVRVVAEQETGTIVGAQAVGPEASELIAELSLAVANELTVEDLASTVHAHPTLAESVMEAAEHALGHAIHTLNR